MLPYIRTSTAGCRQAGYIGLCYGIPGVGKTASARKYAHWDELEAVLGPAAHRHDGIPPPDSGPWRTILYTRGLVKCDFRNYVS